MGDKVSAKYIQGYEKRMDRGKDPLFMKIIGVMYDGLSFYGNAPGRAFAYLLGLITSEGHITSETLEVYNMERSIQGAVISACEEAGFSCHLLRLSKSNRKIKGVRITPNYVARLILAIGGGGKAGNKRIPSLILSSDDQTVSAYLRGYLDGDGCVEQHAITASSKSKNLISDLAYLLPRFGIIARLSPKFKRATNSAKHRGETYWQLDISGKEQVEKFAQSIGFSHPEKEERLQKLIRKYKASKSNTNVDTIPGLQPIFKHLYKSIYPTSEIKTPQVIIDIKNGNYNKSFLKNII